MLGDKGRKHHRLRTNQITELRESAVEAKLVEKDAHVTNVSVGGAFIETTMLFPIGAIVEFSLKLPNVNEVMPVRARVRHIKTKPDPGMGVEFLNIAVEHLEALKEYIETYNS